MNVLLFGATGMIGQGALRECLRAPEVRQVLAVGRSASGQRHEKLADLVTRELADLSPYARQLTGFDACFFTLGATAVGMAEEEYSRLTYDLTLSVARTLLKLNPDLTFIYVSGQGTDSTERGRAMWARVKGRTENALLQLSERAYMFRPGLIVPLHGIRSRTTWYNVFYAIAKPLYPLLRRMAPGSVTTTENLGHAMIVAVREKPPKHVLETAEINTLAAR